MGKDIIEIVKDNRITVTHQGKWLVSDDVEIDCYVTDSKMRLLSLRATARAMNLKGGGSGALLRNLKSKWIQPYLSDRLQEWAVGAEASRLPKIKGVSGPAFIPFEATLLVDICTAYIKAQKMGILNQTQSLIADRMLGIMASFAKVGIVALVDEVTGYQEEREKDELQKILKAYISEELLPWQKKFPDEFYRELFRLNGWEYNLHGIKKRPGVIGTWTNRLVYDELPPTVTEELKTKVPISSAGHKTVRMHQFLTEDIGDPHLKSQLDQILTLFRLSDNMEGMWHNFEKLKDRKRGQFELPFQFDDQGHTIEPIEKTTLSSHNKSLKKALDFNPNEDKKTKKQSTPKLF